MTLTSQPADEDARDLNGAGSAKPPLSDGPVTLTREGAIAWLTLNRPEAANSIDVPLARAFRQAVESVVTDASVRVVVLGGEGKMFCAGGDLASFAREGADAPAYVQGLIEDLHAALDRLTDCPAPVIAAVHGAAAGAGLGLALAADIIVAAEGSRFVMAYVGAGLTPDGGTSWALPRIVGLRRALELTLLNRTLNAAEALDLGLVSEVVPDDQLSGRVRALAEQLAAGPTAAYATARRLIRGSLNTPYPQQLAEEARSIVASFATSDGQEGLRAFSQRRPPLFRGS